MQSFKRCSKEFLINGFFTESGRILEGGGLIKSSPLKGAYLKGGGGLKRITVLESVSLIMFSISN